MDPELEALFDRADKAIAESRRLHVLVNITVDVAWQHLRATEWLLHESNFAMREAVTGQVSAQIGRKRFARQGGLEDLDREEKMSAKAREFIDFWIENSVHAAEQFRSPGASQDVAELTRRCIEMAKSQGITEKAMRDEVGDLAEYIGSKLKAANKTESDRQK
jgi:hypothetical protein